MVRNKSKRGASSPPKASKSSCQTIPVRLARIEIPPMILQMCVDPLKEKKITISLVFR